MHRDNAIQHEVQPVPHAIVAQRLGSGLVRLDVGPRLRFLVGPDDLRSFGSGDPEVVQRLREFGIGCLLKQLRSLRVIEINRAKSLRPEIGVGIAPFVRIDQLFGEVLGRIRDNFASLFHCLRPGVASSVLATKNRLLFFLRPAPRQQSCRQPDSSVSHGCDAEPSAAATRFQRSFWRSDGLTCMSDRIAATICADVLPVMLRT